MSDRPPRPDPLAVQPENVATKLVNRDQWILWAYEFDSDRTEWTKVPRRPDRPDRRASSTTPDHWTEFETAVDALEDPDIDGLGFVFAESGTVAGVDLDDCRNPVTGELKAWAGEVLVDLDTYSEASPSATGAHALCLGFVPEGGNRNDPDHIDGHIEMYDSGRFFTVTGHTIGDTETVKQRNQGLSDIHSRYITEDTDQTGLDEHAGSDTGTDTSSANPEPTDVDLSDSEIVEKAKQSENGDKFARLWRGSTAGYPSHSEADLALCSLLAFWTGGDERRIDSLFRESGLMRSKWDEDHGGQTYGEMTIATAAAGTDTYDPDRSDSSRSDGGRTTVPPKEEAPGTAEQGTPDTPDEPEMPEPEIDPEVLDTPGTAVQDDNDWNLDPYDVLEHAARDNLHPLDYDEDEGGYDGAPRDLRTNERAAYLWDLAKKTGDDTLLAQKKGPVYSYSGGVWTDVDGEQLKTLTTTGLRSAASGTVVSELEMRIRADRQHEPDELGAPEETIMAENGLLDLTDRSRSEPEPTHYATSKIPTEHDPEAECPRWLEFLEDSTQNTAALEKFQEYAGYILWRHAQPFGKAMLLVGPTDSGKGTALKTLRAVIGPDNTASESLSDLVNTRWAPAELFGNVANIRNEVTPSGLNAVEMFKELTGGEDEISAEFKGEDKFKFPVTQKFLFSTNEVPSVQKADQAFYNRLLFVRFPHTVDEADQDKHLLGKLEAERSGILNWMLDGLDRLMDHGQFTAERTTNEKKKLCDAFGGVLDRFIHNALMVTGDPDDVVSKSDLHDLAHAFGDSIDKDPGWSKQSGFSRTLATERGIGQAQRRLNGSNTKVFTGIQVKPEVVYRHGFENDLTTRTADTDEDTDRATDTRRLGEYAEESEDRPGFESTTDQSVPPAVVQSVMDLETEAEDRTATHDALLERLAESGISKSDAEHGIEKCLQRGDIMEPVTDHYRTT